MTDNKKSVIDEIAEDRGISVDDLEKHAEKHKKPDMGKRIIVVSIILLIYASLVVCVFTLKDLSLLFAILIIAFCFLVKPLLNLLKKIFKIQDISKLG